jgi:hypothetical protein
MSPENDGIVRLVRDRGFQALLGGYLESGDGLRDRYDGYASQLSSRRFVVPIAGVQGSGKSTALNAIAFDRRILPADVDETTCVPVEIAWSPEPDANAVVRYVDGTEEVIPATEVSLQAVVHNGENPGNVKGVERVILRSNSAVFRNGLVLVDLPGTGSLTAANMTTTERYLSEAVGVIFMLRTVPPLTRSESIFVALQWARLRTAYFLQNRWSDETEEEANAGLEHNVSVLRDLAARTRIPLDGDPKVHVADADAALNARFSSDAGQLEASGLSAFVDDLETETRDWGRRVRRSILVAVGNDCEHVQALIGERLENLRADSATRREMIVEEGRRFDSYISKVNAKFEEIDRYCRTFRSETLGDLEDWGERRRGDLRNAMRTKLRAGITDGPRLERALQDEQGLAAEGVFEMVEMAVMRFRDDIAGTLQGIDSWAGYLPDQRFTVSSEESTKWENLIPVVLSPAGAIGGGFGGAWAGAQIGAALGSSLGPPGAILGGIVGGVLAGLAALWMGQKSRSVVLEQRAKSVEGEVFAGIDRFIDATRASLADAISEYCKKVEADLSAWHQAQTRVFENQRRRMEEAELLSQEEKDRLIAGLLGDLESVGSYSDLIREAARG